MMRNGSAALLLLLILGLAPHAEAQETIMVIIDNFDDDGTLTNPASQATPPVYSFTTANSNQFVSSAQSHSAPNSWRFQSTATGGYGAYTVIYDACDPDYSAFTFWVYLPALPAAGNTEQFVLGTTAGAAYGGTNTYGMQITDAGVVQYEVNAPGGSASNTNVATISTGVWTDFTFGGFDADCDNIVASSLSSNVLQFVVSVDAQVFANGQTVDDFNVRHGGATPNIIYVDDISVSGITAPERAHFCADPLVENFGGVPAADYGYDYRRGGDFFDSETSDPASIGMSTGFLYDGGPAETDWDYSAKHFATGTKALHQNITIEAGEDTTTSTFRVNYHTQLTTVPDITAKGDGIQTGHFADHLEVQFTEAGSSWQITYWYVNAGGTRNQIGGSQSFGADPNDATQFTIWLDTRPTANIIATLDEWMQFDYYFTGSLHADPFLAVTTASATNGPSGEDNFVFTPRYLDEIAGSAFVDDTVGDVWNIGSGSGALQRLALDENDQAGRANTDDEGNYASTCIFDDAGGAVFYGSQGGDPANDIPPPTPGPTPTSSMSLTGPAQTTDNPIGVMNKLLSDGWGFDWSWLLGAIFLAFTLWLARNANIFFQSVLTVIITVANIKLGLWEEWTIIAMFFLIAALAGISFAQYRMSNGEGAAE